MTTTTLTAASPRRDFLRNYFRNTLFSVLTQLAPACGSEPPFPYLSNKNVGLVVQLKPAPTAAKSGIPFRQHGVHHVTEHGASRASSKFRRCRPQELFCSKKKPSVVHPRVWI